MTQNARKRSVSGIQGTRAPARLRSLLVPIDLTPGSDRVLGRIALLPLADDARVTLLHVVSRGLPSGERRRAEWDAGRALAEEARHLRKSMPRLARIETRVKPGAPAKEIGASAARVKAELIVMGRGGRSLREEFLGSTAERVIRQAQLPVLVVRLPPRAAYRRPVLALDTDRAAHEVVRLMLLVLPPPRPRVAVVHAFDVPYRSLISTSLSDDEVSEMEDRYQLEATQELSTLLHTASSKANVPPEDTPDWKTHVRYGSPRVVVGKFMMKAEADLLMLGTRGYSGVAQAFVGTVAGDLLRKAKCDVVVVPPPSSRQ